MRVLCVKLINPVTGEVEASSSWLRLHAEYEVLEIYAYPDRRIELRLVSDEAEVPALFDSEMFITTDGSIPRTWAVKIEEGGVMRLGPEHWLAPGFWEDFFDRDPAAVEAYEVEKAAILSSGP